MFQVLTKLDAITSSTYRECLLIQDQFQEFLLANEFRQYPADVKVKIEPQDEVLFVTEGRRQEVCSPLFFIIIVIFVASSSQSTKG